MKTNEKGDNYFVHQSSYVDENVNIGEGTKIWHFSHIQSGTQIGNKCVLGQNVNVGNNVVIGNNVKIQNNVSIYEGVELEDFVFCGPSMVFTNILNPRSEFPQRGSEFYIRTLVKKSASLGANSTIVCGNTIGIYAFIAAGAVVIMDVPDYALVAGNPAKVKGWMCACGTKLDLTVDQDSLEAAGCSKCKRRYKKERMKVEQI
jgi:UDP-2-acetamido-3-amino-2,3-dideoxy-glucuronate N-acetyltransferase